jgi:hypothetical protein
MRRDGIGGAENGSQNQAAIISPLLNMDEPGTTQ